MNLAPLALVFLSVLAAGYFFYGRIVARQLGLDAEAQTPARQLNDGVDYVPTKPFYLMSQHFSAIAAAGPIVGPIVACQQFGWLPCLLWIGLGVVLIGAVHDFSALVASVRHRARSIAEVVKENLGRRAWLAMMAFIWIALVYVIVAFADLTAGTFVGRIEELDGRAVAFERGGAVAFASIAYLTLAIVMGLVQRRWNPPLWILTLVFVPATLGVVWLGTQCSTWFLLGPKTWGVVILGYCFIASLLPVWLLLQPRGYLGGFVLYIVLAVGVIGVFFGGFGIEQPGFKGWEVQGSPTGVLFPFLFVTIACGACSGFHGLVCSGTTSKQIANEKHCRPIGYGGMLLEGFVALIALSTVMIVAKPAGAPGAIYGLGIGKFLTLLIGEENLLFATIFGSMAFSTFVFDTLDVSTRLGRYILQELFNARSRPSAALATLATLGVPLGLILAAEPAAPGKPAAYMAFWTLFGTSNQLLAALSLLGVSVWLFRRAKPTWFTLLPMLFVMTITMWALVLQVTSVFKAQNAGRIAIANSVVAVLLIGLACVLIVESILAARRHVRTASALAPAGARSPVR
jgi:carbon starvation protein